MIKRLISVILCAACLMCVGAAVSAELTLVGDENSDSLPLVVDEAGLLTEGEISALETTLTGICADYNVDLVIVTVNSTDGKSDEEYADDYYDYGGYGRDEEGSGALLLLDMDSRYVHISTKGWCINALFDSRIEDILDYVVEELGEGDYYGAFSVFADETAYYFSDWLLYGQYEQDEEIEDPDIYVDPSTISLWDKIMITLQSFGVIAGGVGAAAGGITTAIMRGNLKSVHNNNGAEEYVREGSAQLTSQNDIYLYSHTVRHHIDRDRGNSGGGGGGHTGPSTTHTSSSGATHGGGGRSF